VQHALEETQKALASGGDIFILGDLIHNSSVIQRLAAKGLKRVGSIDEVEKGGKLVIGAHGVAREIYEKAEKRGISLIDTTCMFVKKAQNSAALLCREGYQVFLVGDPDHTEVRGIVSAAGGPVNILSKREDLEKVKPGRKAGLLFQTTQSTETSPLFSSLLVEKFEETRVFNTICRATSERQEAVRELAKSVDAVVIVGDKKSANTKRLAAIASEINPKSIMVEDASQLDRLFFAGIDTVGITAGASTPDWIIDNVKSRLESF